MSSGSGSTIIMFCGSNNNCQHAVARRTGSTTHLSFLLSSFISLLLYPALFLRPPTFCGLRCLCAKSIAERLTMRAGIRSKRLTTYKAIVSWMPAYWRLVRLFKSCRASGLGSWMDGDLGRSCAITGLEWVAS